MEAHILEERQKEIQSNGFVLIGNVVCTCIKHSKHMTKGIMEPVKIMFAIIGELIF